MSFKSSKRLLTVSAATKVIAFMGLVTLQNQAYASSVCQADELAVPQTFNCVDEGPEPVEVADGTYSAGGLFSGASNGGFSISSTSALTASLNGTLNASTAESSGSMTAVSLSTSDSLNFTSTGVVAATSPGIVNGISLNGLTVTASTGNATVTGGNGSRGVTSIATGGDQSLTATSTTVSGTWSRGLFTDAYAGNNLTTTGAVSASGTYSWGVVARSLSSPEGCVAANSQSTTVNVTGNISADFVGVATMSCGTTAINVSAGTTVRSTDSNGYAALQMAEGTASTVIDGSLLAASAADRALDIRAGGSSTIINNGGLLSGTFDGDAGVDAITLNAGAAWETASSSNFGAGNDSLVNAGTIRAEAAQFTGLNSFTNSGVLAISGGSLTLQGNTTFENAGVIQIAAGETVITSDAVFYNNGTIDLQNGNVGDILTITNDYTAGANAAIYLDVGGEKSDTFIVSGVQTGTTQVFVSGAMGMTAEGIRIGTIDDTSSPSGGTSTPISGKFVAGNQASPLIDYHLNLVGSDLILYAAPNTVAFQPLALSEASSDLWHASADAVGRQALLRQSQDGERKVSLWGETFVANDRAGDRTTKNAFGFDTLIDSRIKTSRFGMQIGLDVRASDRINLGLTGGYERADLDFRASSGGAEISGFNVGTYLAYNYGGTYAGILIKYDRGTTDFEGIEFADADRNPDLVSWGAQFRAGHEFPTRFGSVTAAGELSYVSNDLENFSAGGIDYRFGSNDAWRGAVGLEAAFGNGNVAPYASAKLLTNLGGKRSLSLSDQSESDTVKISANRIWGRLEAGFRSTGAKGFGLGAWLDVGDLKGFGARAGIRF